MQPLHIFEPRYCEMLADSLKSDRLIAMATLADQASTKTLGQPPIAATVCLGRIISHVELEDDRHNVLLVGTKRARIVRELDAGRPFRIAEVDVCDDVYPAASQDRRLELKQQLLEAFGSVIPPSANIQQNLHELMAGQMGLGPITDIISYTLPFPTPQKLQLLAQANVDERARELIQLLQSGSIELHSVSIEEQSLELPPSSNDQFPPPFSVN
jgi:ATP-dependent Lon protease